MPTPIHRDTLQMREQNLTRIVVTRSDGTLIGVLRREQLEWTIRFIVGDPMNPPTNALAGRTYTS
jgi:hypothetical protein